MNRVHYRMNEQTLSEINPSAFSLGDIAIFTSLQSYEDIPWYEMDISDTLNRYYYGLRSGDKIISPLVEKLVTGVTISLTEMDILAKIAHDMFIKRWSMLWRVRESEYNPINNYDMTENETINTGKEYDTTHTRTDNLAHTKTGYETTTPNITEQVTPNINTKNDRGVYGFNSDPDFPEAVDTDTDNQLVTGTNSTTTTGNNRVDYNVTDSNTGTETTTNTGTDTDETVRELTRSGNIGVTTTQQMLQSEIELWQWDFFREVVFPDIDRILTIQVY